MPLTRGVRKLSLLDQLPSCEIRINDRLYDLKDIVKGKKVLDIGCGHGQTREAIEKSGGEWFGMERFEGGFCSVLGDAECLPFKNHSFDVVFTNSVLEHIQNVALAFKEAARVLKKNGLFVGYAAFMECFHEISYCHLSFRALEHFSRINGLRLLKISGGSGFGIDYHLAVLLYPLDISFLRPFLAFLIRGIFWIKSKAAYVFLRRARKKTDEEAKTLSLRYFQLECLRQSNGFTFVIQKL